MREAQWSLVSLKSEATFMWPALKVEEKIRCFKSCVKNVSREMDSFQQIKYPIGRNAQCWSNILGHFVHKIPDVNTEVSYVSVCVWQPAYFGCIIEFVWWENSSACDAAIVLRLCLVVMKCILLFSFYVCSNACDFRFLGYCLLLYDFHVK